MNELIDGELTQDLCWKAAGEPVPVFSADFSGAITNHEGEVLSITNESFAPLDDDEGTFRLYLTKEDIEIARRGGDTLSLIVWGQLKGFNRIPILKRPLNV